MPVTLANASYRVSNIFRNLKRDLFLRLLYLALVHVLTSRLKLLRVQWKSL